MNSFLFSTYLATIIVLIISIMIIILSWRAYIPRRWLTLFITYFVALIGGIIILLTAELLAPYDSNFYFNPFLYLASFMLTGSSMISIYFLVFEIHFKHIKLLKITGCIFFIVIIILLTLSGVLLLFFEFSDFPWIAYLAFEGVYGLGIAAYTLLAIGSFSHMSSERLEQNIRHGLTLVGIFSLGIVFGLSLIAISLFYIDFSIAINPFISIFWLLWICFIAILFLLMFKRAISLLT